MTRGACPELRAALAEYLARARGVRAAPGERIVVCSGFAQAWRCSAGRWRARGAARLAIEAYGDRGTATSWPRTGWMPRRCRWTSTARSSTRQATPTRSLLTPAHQFPLGMPLAPHRRAGRSAGERGGGLVIEDDYDGEFRYDRQPVGAMQALAPDHVVYCGTASKSLAPGVRLAWLVAAPDLLDEVVAAKRPAGTRPLDQLTLAELVTSGAYDRHVRRAPAGLPAPPRPLARPALDAECGLRVRGIAAGLHALVDLPHGHGGGPRRRRGPRRAVWR